MSFRRKIPALLTYSRIIAVPLLIFGFYVLEPKDYWMLAALFFFASFTDFLDGYLARLWNAESMGGRILDPIADKLLVVAALLPLLEQDKAPLLPVLIILLREIFVSGLREYLLAEQISVPVSLLAKYKTAVQLLAIFLLLLGNTAEIFQTSGAIILWIAALLTLVTGVNYFLHGWKELKNK